MRKEYDIFILKELTDIIEDEESEFIVRDLTPGTHKYKQMPVRALLSRDADKYPDTLWIRLGKGQLLSKSWSIKIIKKLNNIPEEFL